MSDVERAEDDLARLQIRVDAILASAVGVPEKDLIPFFQGAIRAATDLTDASRNLVGTLLLVGQRARDAAVQEAEESEGRRAATPITLNNSISNVASPVVNVTGAQATATATPPALPPKEDSASGNKLNLQIVAGLFALAAAAVPVRCALKQDTARTADSTRARAAVKGPASTALPPPAVPTTPGTRPDSSLAVTRQVKAGRP